MAWKVVYAEASLQIRTRWHQRNVVLWLAVFPATEPIGSIHLSDAPWLAIPHKPTLLCGSVGIPKDSPRTAAFLRSSVGYQWYQFAVLRLLTASACTVTAMDGSSPQRATGALLTVKAASRTVRRSSPRPSLGTMAGNELAETGIRVTNALPGDAYTGCWTMGLRLRLSNAEHECSKRRVLGLSWYRSPVSRRRCRAPETALDRVGRRLPRLGRRRIDDIL